MIKAHAPSKDNQEQSKKEIGRSFPSPQTQEYQKGEACHRTLSMA